MIRRIPCFLPVAAAFAAGAHAHDFWIEPESYQPAPGEPVELSVLVGHGADTSAWPLAPHRVIGLRSLGPDGLQSHVNGAESVSGDVSLSFDTPGLHMVFIETTNSFSALPAEEFNGYIEEEGVLPIVTDRVKTRRENEEGRELYSRRGKALVKAGCGAPDSPVWSKQLGLTLEITAGRNPFSWDDGEAFPVTVLYHGAPVPQAMLHVTSLSDDETSFTVQTNADGTAGLDGLTEGRWLVHTVWAEPVDGLLEDADYQTVFSSLTFSTEDECADG